MRMRQAIVAALADEMDADPRVVLLGEDVGAAGGVFKTTEGLFDRFGAQRVRDTPIAEMGFLGAAVGAASAGLRPVVEIMFAEFLGVALDQVVTEAANLRYLSRGEYTAPLVVRCSAGPGLGFGAQHSQTLESWLINTPGLKVVAPSGAQSAYGLLRAAIRDEDPVVFLEPRILYGDREDVDTALALPELGRARIVRTGADVTVVALGQTVPTALAAADLGSIDAEVVDLQTISPVDRDTILDSVRRTRRLAIVEANPWTGGWGTGIAADVATELFGELRAPVLRITSPDIPVPYSRALESRYVPDAGYVSSQIAHLIANNRVPTPWWKEIVDA
ncbi:alpha-ketoacid dehydrogenase subunit beta [Pseudonocardia sp. GCM10023141]|uniref:alpha-ketoacid dehydrogenase subunit beta n=1 Tax=Pseudonocardia sp. GCM10023141 TaxID=3252653 RepID=UPI00361C8875